MSMQHWLQLINRIPPWEIGRICVELEDFFRNAMRKGTTAVHYDAAIFPVVMNRIFGSVSGVSLYIRNIVPEPQNVGYCICFDFFSPNGPLFWYFKRLFDSTTPFHLPINQLPQQLQHIICSGTHPGFFKNPKIGMDITYSSLQMNAFQCFMFKFALYGLSIPTLSREMIDRKTETLYLALVAEYVCTYLPRSITPPSKETPLNVQPLTSPNTTAKYLVSRKLSDVAPRLINPGMDSATSLDLWRAESIITIFLDVWLSSFLDNRNELPSIELLRCIRILVKQIHAFCDIGSNIDCCPMEELRRDAPLQLRERIEPFFITLFDVWPLDPSLIDLIELWLSYIQPWRYMDNLNLVKAPTMVNEFVIMLQFSRFIRENLVSYTQPIVKLLPRLAQFDMTTPISTKILTRLLKVVSNESMLNFIRRNEIILYHLRQQHDISGPIMSTSTLPEEENPPIDLEEIDAVRLLGASVIDPTRYTPLFSEPVQHQLCQLMRQVCCAISHIKGRIRVFERKQKKHNIVVRYFLQALGYEQSVGPYKTAQDDCAVLESICHWLTYAFAIPAFEVPPSDEFEPEDSNEPNVPPSPGFSNRNKHICTQRYLGDPQLAPINNREIKFLVRALYSVSMKVNSMYSKELSSLWYSERWWGSLARQMLQPPSSYMERAQLHSGFSTLVETSVGPRLSLRSFASYAAVRNVVGALVFGALVFGSPIYGLIILVLLSLVLTLLRKIIKF